jgi:low affinity Fe/Cu permease
MNRESTFNHLAKRVAHAAGHPAAATFAAIVVVAWLASGPVFRFSDSWQLVINTGTTIVTFLMVFLIQNTQNRDAAAVQLKLDELIRAARGAQNTLLNIEELSDEELEAMHKQYEALAEQARGRLRKVQQVNRKPAGQSGQ